MDGISLEEKVIDVLSRGWSRNDVSRLSVLLEFIEKDFAAMATSSYSSHQSNVSSIAPFSSIECYRAVLHLYVLYPACVDIPTVRKILIKCFLNVWTKDFDASLLVLPSKVLIDPFIRPIVQLHESLQACKFKEVWEALHEPAFQDISSIYGCAEILRDFMIDVLHLCYHTQSMNELTAQLNLTYPGAEMDRLIRIHDWKLEEGTEKGVLLVHLPHVDTTLFSTNIVCNRMGGAYKAKVNAALNATLNASSHGTEKHFNIDNLKTYFSILKGQQV